MLTLYDYSCNENHRSRQTHHQHSAAIYCMKVAHHIGERLFLFL